MKVNVSNVTLKTKSCIITIGDKAYNARITIPNNKGAENDLWVDMRPLKTFLGEGEHKNWLTINKSLATDYPNRKPEDITELEVETTKKPQVPHHITSYNIFNYLSAEEVIIVLPLLQKAEQKLQAEKDAIEK